MRGVLPACDVRDNNGSILVECARRDGHGVWHDELTARAQGMLSAEGAQAAE